MVNKRVAPAATLCLCLLGSVAHSQGVPVIDGTNLAKNIEQLQAALRDAENQIAQIEELKRQVEIGLEQITNLEGILGSISGLNEIASLYNSAQDLRSRAAKITDLSGFTDAIAIGDFDSLMASLLDGNVTMGDKMAAEYMEDTLASAGLSSETLAGLSSSENPQDKRIAETAAASATAMASEACGCLFEDFPFEAFTTELLVKPPADLTDADRPTLETYLTAEQSQVDDSYRALEKSCRAK